MADSKGLEEVPEGMFASLKKAAVGGFFWQWLDYCASFYAVDGVCENVEQNTDIATFQAKSNPTTMRPSTPSTR